MKRNILLNDNIPYHTSQRGVSRYFRAIADGLTDHFGDQVIVYSPENRDYKSARYVPAIHLPRMRMRLHHLLGKTIARLTSPAIVYSAYYASLQTPACEIYTVYDMIHELYEQYFPRRPHIRQFMAQKKDCIERAAALITISKNTAKDVVALYPNIDENKIKTIYLGVSDFYFGAPCLENTSAQVSKPYFLYVGHRELYKNFFNLLEAFEKSNLKKDFDLRIISPTGTGFSDKERLYIVDHSLQENVHLMIDADETALRNSYAGAVGYICPSEYEGFGLTVLEAMASGTVVGAANASSLPEVGGEIAFYFDPHSVDAIAACLKKIAELPGQARKQRIQAGKDWAKTFSWERCQQETISLFETFLT